jgi:hypothetical protein
VRVALQKQPGVDAVDVSLEKATVDVRLRAGNAITLAQVREIIKSNGFTSRDATLTAVGTLVQRGGGPVFEVSGTNIALRIVADAASPAAFEQLRSLVPATGERSVELTGTVAANQQEQIAVRSIRLLDK